MNESKNINAKVKTEICICEHLKECHKPHILDIHGGECTHCKCKEYTWKEFLWSKI